MIRQINTITGRTVLVLFVFMGILHVVSLWTYRSAIDDEIATKSPSRKG